MTIKTYQEAHKEQIASLIINIQRGEFNVPITLSDQPDLANIPSFYQIKNGDFWVAENDLGEVVGTIALIDIGENEGVIRKMFVHKDFRGKTHGVAQSLFNALFEKAKKHQMHALYLGTIDRLAAAIRFYERNGFSLIEKQDLPPNFPLMAVDTHFFQLHF
jgi:putative acetyltransferase